MRILDIFERIFDTILPLRARSKDGVVLLDAVSGMPLKILLLNPW